ncbi:hypothetical protein Hanom_Chr02g00106751 [Helianthus anomalus]
MSSQKESNVNETPQVELSDGESVELVDELKDVNEVASTEACAKGKRKNFSQVQR